MGRGEGSQYGLKLEAINFSRLYVAWQLVNVRINSLRDKVTFEYDPSLMAF